MKTFLARIRKVLESMYGCYPSEEEVRAAIARWQGVTGAAVEVVQGDDWAWNYVRRTHRSK